MEKMRVKYIKMMFNRKKNKGGFFEKNKDTLGGLVSMLTILGIAYTVLVVILRYIYSVKAANFYQLEKSLFNQEDLVVAMRLSLNLILHLLWWFFPLLPLQIIRMYNNSDIDSIPTSDILRKIELNFIRISYIFIVWIVDVLLSKFFVWGISTETIRQFYIPMAIILRGLPSLTITVIFFKFITFLICKFKNNNGGKAVKLEYNLDDRNWLIIIGFIIVWIILACFIHRLLLPDSTEEYDKIKSGLILYRIFSCLVLQYFCFNEKENSKLSILQIIIVIVFAVSEIIIFISAVDVFVKDMKLLEPSQKRNYEIVQNIEDLKEPRASDSNLQVVILHTGSQILLMNGTINNGGVEIKSPKDITSSSNLYLDISSYEIHDDNKYSFHWRSFASVKRKYGDYLLDKDDEEKNNAE